MNSASLCLDPLSPPNPQQRWCPSPECHRALRYLRNKYAKTATIIKIAIEEIKAETVGDSIDCNSKFSILRSASPIAKSARFRRIKMISRIGFKILHPKAKSRSGRTTRAVQRAHFLNGKRQQLWKNIVEIPHQANAVILVRGTLCIRRGSTHARNHPVSQAPLPRSVPCRGA